MTYQIFSFWTSLKFFTESCVWVCILRFLLSRSPAQASQSTVPLPFAATGGTNSSPCARVRNKKAEDPCQAAALPLNLAKGEQSVSYLFKRAGGAR